jgi:hypothetical protein
VWYAHSVFTLVQIILIAYTVNLIIGTVTRAITYPSFRNTVTIRALKSGARRAILIFILSIRTILVYITYIAPWDAASVVALKPWTRWAILILIFSSWTVNKVVTNPGSGNTEVGVWT